MSPASWYKLLCSWLTLFELLDSYQSLLAFQRLKQMKNVTLHHRGRVSFIISFDSYLAASWTKTLRSSVLTCRARVLTAHAQRRYVCMRAFIFHTTRRQGTFRVEIMRVLLDVNLWTLVHLWPKPHYIYFRASVELSGVGALCCASSLHWRSFPLLVWITEKLGLTVRDK